MVAQVDNASGVDSVKERSSILEGLHMFNVMLGAPAHGGRRLKKDSRDHA